jgi:hypothetical protein
MKSSSYPKLKLVVDPTVDARFGVNFVEGNIRNLKNFLSRFLPYTLQYILAGKISKQKRDKLILGYAKYCYKNHRNEIERGTKAAASDWKKVENRYFRLIDRLFKKHSWPKGYYVGFATVWHSYPRNIQNKTFHFPYWHSLPKYANKVISHEMLHFMFFDYIQERYGLQEKSIIKGKSKDYVWKISEAFNNVIEEWKPYKSIFKHPARPYKETVKIFKKMNEQWKQRQDIDWLLDKWFSKNSKKRS